MKFHISTMQCIGSNYFLQLLLDSKELSQSDVHIHFPAGAVGKDGPSAGVTITTVLVSLFSKQCVRSDTAMTGEITLRGIVLPVSNTFVLLLLCMVTHPVISGYQLSVQSEII